jgi:nucleoid-associated protein YgaU
VVKENDTLWSLSQKFYEGRKNWWFIYEANKDRIDDPNVLKAGVEIIMPEENASSQPSREQGATASAPSAVDQKGSYTVKPYDTLIKIAQKVYGSDRYWRDIWAANENQIQNPDDLKVGMILKLPKIEQ